MSKATDYETAIFVSDCREKAVNGIIPKKQMVEAFWAWRSELFITLKQANFSDEEIAAEFGRLTYYSVCAKLTQHGITVEE